MKRAISAVVLLIGLAAGLIAQESTGNVYGHVADEQGAGLPGATVTLSGPTTGGETTASDARGDFHFLRLAPATYRLTADLPGFTKVVRDNVVVTLGKNTELTLVLEALPCLRVRRSDQRDAHRGHPQDRERRDVFHRRSCRRCRPGATSGS